MQKSVYLCSVKLSRFKRNRLKVIDNQRYTIKLERKTAKLKC